MGLIGDDGGLLAGEIRSQEMRQTLRLVTYNLQRGIHYDRIRTHFKVLPVLQRADIVAVQEVGVSQDGTNTLARLAADLKGGRGWTYRTVMSYPGKEYGNGFLFRSTVRPVTEQVVPLPRLDRLGWVARLKTEGGKPDTKSAFAQIFEIGRRRLRVISVHLDFAGGTTHRVRQLRHLLGALNQVDEADGHAVDILCGDFNTCGFYRSKVAKAETRQLLDVALTRGFTDCSASVPWTSDLFSSIDTADPARRLLRFGQMLGLRYRQKLDHLLVRGAHTVAPAAAVVIPGWEHLPGSDHLPVVLELVV